MSNQPWYMYNIVVPFGNSHFDVGLGGSHDMDIGAPPNYPVTALLPGTVCDIAEPSWGKQLGLQLDAHYNGIPYMAYLHLSAINPDLAQGKHVNAGEVIGWVGGATSASQYAGTSNPTGANFTNDVAMSSRVQVGIALMRGPVYGSGAGWEAFPPIDMSLDPTPVILAARQKYTAAQPPQGWTDDGTTLRAPDGTPVVMGFRAYILSHPWEQDNWPLSPEAGLVKLEASNPALGGGTQQLFKKSMLGYTDHVFEEYVGSELDYTRKQYALLFDAYQKLKVQQQNPQLLADMQAVKALAQKY